MSRDSILPRGPAGVMQVDHVVVRVAQRLVAVRMTVRLLAFASLVSMLVMTIVEVLVGVLHRLMLVQDFLVVLARPQPRARQRQRDADQSQDKAGCR